MQSPLRYGALIAGMSLFALLAALFLNLQGTAAEREIEAACKGLRPNAKNASFASFPAALPAFRAQSDSNAMVSNTDLRGKITLLNFWATWCDVCKSEKPSLLQLQKDMGDEIDIITVASESDWSEVQKQFKGGLPFRTLLDTPPPGENIGRIAQSFGITAVPESFLIDENGQIVFYFVNKRNWSSVVARRCLRAALDGELPGST
jgi:cytochrome c biogenesis protein CcmG/thiol:disulfide interchange protein DsbE